MDIAAVLESASPHLSDYEGNMGLVARAKPKDAENGKAFKLAVIALIVPTVLNLSIFGYQIIRDLKTGKSVDSRFGDTTRSIANIETSLRILTQAVAPQIYDSIRDSLSAATNSSGATAAVALNKTSSALQAMREQQVPPNRQQVKELATALKGFEQENASAPEFWKASAQLVSFTTSSFKSSTQADNCLSQGHVPFKMAKMNNGTVMPAYDQVLLENCTLALDDIDGFNNSLDGKAIQWGMKKAGPGTILQLHLRNVHVIYKGGRIIPEISSIFFDHCFIHLDYEKIPSPRGKQMTQELLTADNDQSAIVSFAVGE